MDLLVYQEINFHLDFDVKKNFTWKAWFVANGSRLTDRFSNLLKGVVISYIIQLALLIVTLNVLKVNPWNIGNACLNISCKENICFESGKECDKLYGQPLILVRALYGLKYSGAVWCAISFICLESNEVYTNGCQLGCLHQKE